MNNTIQFTKTQKLINERATDARIRKLLNENVNQATSYLDELYRKLELAIFCQHIEAGLNELDAPTSETIELEQGQRSLDELNRKLSRLEKQPNPDLVRIIKTQINLELNK